MRTILHIDLDAFFANAEHLRHPEHRGKPLIVGGSGDPSRRGVVSTANYEARRFGVHSGMPLRTARQHCPGAVFLPVDYRYYLTLSRRFKKILRETSPPMEDVGIDEAYLDISHCGDGPLTIARRIQQRLFTETGLTCSIGIAPNKLLAKLGSELDKPNGVTRLTEADIEARIWPLPARKLQGVGPKTAERLAALGLGTIGDLARYPLGDLAHDLGPAHAYYLHQSAWGRDDSPIVTHHEPKSISRETTYQIDVGDWKRLEHDLRELTAEVIQRLTHRGYRARQVTVKLRYADFETHTRASSLPEATDDAQILQHLALQCLHRFPRHKRVRLIGVCLGEITKEREEEKPQARLF